MLESVFYFLCDLRVNRYVPRKTLENSSRNNKTIRLHLKFLKREKFRHLVSVFLHKLTYKMKYKLEGAFHILDIKLRINCVFLFLKILNEKKKVKSRNTRREIMVALLRSLSLPDQFSPGLFPYTFFYYY